MEEEREREELGPNPKSQAFNGGDCGIDSSQPFREREMFFFFFLSLSLSV